MPLRVSSAAASRAVRRRSVDKGPRSRSSVKVRLTPVNAQTRKPARLGTADRARRAKRETVRRRQRITTPQGSPFLPAPPEVVPSKARRAARANRRRTGRVDRKQSIRQASRLLAGQKPPDLSGYVAERAVARQIRTGAISARTGRPKIGLKDALEKPAAGGLFEPLSIGSEALKSITPKSVRRELSGQGRIGKAALEVGDEVAKVVEATMHARAASSPTVSPRLKKKKGGGALPAASITADFADTSGSRLAGRTAKDFVEVAAQAIPSLAITAEAGLAYAGGDKSKVHRLVKEFKRTSILPPLVSGDLKEAAKRANEHPGYAILELAGAKGALGRTAGTAARTAGRLAGQSAKTAGGRIGSLERADLQLYPSAFRGKGPAAKREYSRDAITKAGQVALERHAAKGNRLASAVLGVERGKPNVAAIDSRRRRKAIERLVDDHMFVTVGRIKADRGRVEKQTDQTVPGEFAERTVNELTGTDPRSGDPRTFATRLAAEGIIRNVGTVAEDLQRYLEFVVGNVKRAGNEGRKFTKAQQKAHKHTAKQLLELLNDDEFLENPNRYLGAAMQFARAQTRRDVEQVRRGIIGEDEAAAKYAPAAMVHLGAEYASRVPTDALLAHWRARAAEATARQVESKARRSHATATRQAARLQGRATVRPQKLPTVKRPRAGTTAAKVLGVEAIHLRGGDRARFSKGGEFKEVEDARGGVAGVREGEVLVTFKDGTETIQPHDFPAEVSVPAATTNDWAPGRTGRGVVLRDGQVHVFRDFQDELPGAAPSGQSFRSHSDYLDEIGREYNRDTVASFQVDPDGEAHSWSFHGGGETTLEQSARAVLEADPRLHIKPLGKDEPGGMGSAMLGEAVRRGDVPTHNVAGRAALEVQAARQAHRAAAVELHQLQNKRVTQARSSGKAEGVAELRVSEADKKLLETHPAYTKARAKVSRTATELRKADKRVNNAEALPGAPDRLVIVGPPGGKSHALRVRASSPEKAVAIAEQFLEGKKTPGGDALEVRAVVKDEAELADTIWADARIEGRIDNQASATELVRARHEAAINHRNAKQELREVLRQIQVMADVVARRQSAAGARARAREGERQAVVEAPAKPIVQQIKETGFRITDTAFADLERFLERVTGAKSRGKRSKDNQRRYGHKVKHGGRVHEARKGKFEFTRDDFEATIARGDRSDELANAYAWFAARAALQGDPGPIPKGAIGEPYRRLLAGDTSPEIHEFAFRLYRQYQEKGTDVGGKGLAENRPLGELEGPRYVVERFAGGRIWVVDRLGGLEATTGRSQRLTQHDTVDAAQKRADELNADDTDTRPPGGPPRVQAPKPVNLEDRLIPLADLGRAPRAPLSRLERERAGELVTENAIKNARDAVRAAEARVAAAEKAGRRAVQDERIQAAVRAREHSRALYDSLQDAIAARKQAAKVTRASRPQKGDRYHTGFTLNGRPISTRALEGKLRDVGISPEHIAFVSQKPFARGAVNYYTNVLKHPSVKGQRRTGEAVKFGFLDTSKDAIIESAVRSQVRLTVAERWEAMIAYFAERAPHLERAADGTDLSVLGGQWMRDYATAQKVAQEVSEQLGTPMRPVNLTEFNERGSRAAVVRERLATKTGVLDDERFLQELSEGLLESFEKDTGPGRYAIMPAEVFKRFQDHNKPSGETAKAAQAVSGWWVRNVLSTSPKWVPGNIIDITGRGVLYGGAAWFNPLAVYRGVKVLDALKKIDPEAHRNFMEYAVGGAMYTTTLRGQRHRTAEQMAGGGLRKVAATMALVGRIPPVMVVRGFYNGWVQSVFGLNRGIELVSNVGALGVHARREIGRNLESMEGALVTGGQAFDEFVRGLTNTDTQTKAARYVEEVFGRWGKLGPRERDFLIHYAPFAQWLRVSTKFVFVTLPTKHPIKTGILAGLTQMTEVEREALGMTLFPPSGKPDELAAQERKFDAYNVAHGTNLVPYKGPSGERSLPPFLQGSVPFPDGSKIRFQGFTSFGVAAGLPESLADFLLPQTAGAQDALRGLSWKGDKLRNEDGTPASFEQRLLIAFDALAAGWVPLWSHAHRAMTRGQPDTTSTLLAPKTKKTADDEGYGSRTFDVFRRIKPQERSGSAKRPGGRTPAFLERGSGSTRKPAFLDREGGSTRRPAP